ncbi:MAG: magnesium-translocating P-type ATPase [Chlamydiales bacterium]
MSKPEQQDINQLGQLSIDQLYAQLKSSQKGLTGREAKNRLKRYGFNSLKPPSRGKGILLLLAQFKSPLILLLIGAALLSFFLGGKTDALIIFTIVLLSGLLGFFQERGALNSLEKLLQLVENKTTLLRDGKETAIPVEKIVPGDLVILRAGDIIPADSLLIEAKHLFVDESTLTGESAPVEKMAVSSIEENSKQKKLNILFQGTIVASGIATAIVGATGLNTEYSQIVERIRFRPLETAFERGVQKFGYFLLEVTLILVITIFAVNTYFNKPIIESLLFSLALAVGLTPQLLPAIITINLTHGARKMAEKHVIIKRLPSIENFGQMNILCTDKTGTITEGKIKLDRAIDINGQDSSKATLYAYLNAHFQLGYVNPLDQAITAAAQFDVSNWEKIDEIPYDFIRKRLGLIFNKGGEKILITKGAFPQVLSICNRVELPNGSVEPIENYKKQIEDQFEEQCRQGFRTLAVAYGAGKEEASLIFLGLLTFLDPIKPDIAQAVSDLKKLGIHLKIITGDHQAVVAHIASFIGIPHAALITGEELDKVSDSALLKIVRDKNIFAEIQPNQKERIILALRKSGHVVGYLGDGVNDVSALHSADVGIAVDSGSSAAKESADIVLLEKNLEVLRIGVEEGRRTFANTMKYVFMATSANFGNMFSMAGASLFLSFLPLLPKQVLLTNFLSDFPEMALATDRVDAAAVARPMKWDLPFIKRFMMVFGLLNSFADFMTFAVLLLWLNADEVLFRTGWFVENVVSAALVVLAIRTRGPLFDSKPGLLLTFAVIATSVFVLFVPLTGFGHLFGFGPLPLSFYAVLISIICVYIFSVEVAKYFFYRKLRNHSR